MQVSNRPEAGFHCTLKTLSSNLLISGAIVMMDTNTSGHAKNTDFIQVAKKS